MSSQPKNKIVIIVIAVAALFLLVPYLGLTFNDHSSDEELSIEEQVEENQLHGNHAHDNANEESATTRSSPHKLSDIESMLKGRGSQGNHHGEN